MQLIHTPKFKRGRFLLSLVTTKYGTNRDFAYIHAIRVRGLKIGTLIGTENWHTQIFDHGPHLPRHVQSDGRAPAGERLAASSPPIKKT